MKGPKQKKTNQVRMIELLHAVGEKPAIDLEELAECVEATQTGLNRLIRRAERKGLVEQGLSSYRLDHEAIRRFLLVEVPPLVVDAVHRRPGRRADTVFNAIDCHHCIPREIFDQIVSELLANYTLVGSRSSLHLNQPQGNLLWEACGSTHAWLVA